MEKEDKMVTKNDKAADKAAEYVIKLKKPIDYEGKRYDCIDLSGLYEIKAADMVMINRRLTRSGNVDSTQEIRLEYALHMANAATGIPLEFFEQLPPYAALAIKECVMSFLFGRG